MRFKETGTGTGFPEQNFGSYQPEPDFQFSNPVSYRPEPEFLKVFPVSYQPEFQQSTGIPVLDQVLVVP